MAITITVTADGFVTITGRGVAPETTTPPRWETIEVCGGTLGYSPQSLGRLPEALIDDFDAALPWLREIYGQPILAEASALLASSQQLDDDGSVELPDDAWHPTGPSRLASRVCLAEWLLQWWPSRGVGIHSLDVPLLALERSTLKSEAPLLFDPAETARQLESLVPDVARRLPRMLDEPNAIDSTSQALWRGSQAMTQLLDIDTPALHAIATAVAARGLDPASDEFDWAVGEVFALLDDWGELAGHPEPSAETTREGFALAADHPLWESPDRWFTVDPIQVAARSVGGRGENASLLVDRESDTLAIRVDQGDRPVAGLMARVWAAGALLPRMVRLASGQDCYLGEVALDDLDVDTFDVFDPRLVSSPRSAEEVLADWDFIADVVRRRLRGAERGTVADDQLAAFAVESPR